MDGYTVSEHCFDFKDSTHKTGTNKYEFRYPQSWYLMNAICDLSVGIRNIILKPGPIDISLNNLWLGAFASIKTTSGVSTAQAIEHPSAFVSIAGVPLQPERIPLMFSAAVDEKVDMIDFCDKLNKQYKEDYSIFEKQCIDAYQAYKYMGITDKSARFYYDGGFGMSTNNLNQYFIYTVAGTLDKGTFMDLRVDLFDDKFHQLMGLDYTNYDQNLNMILKKLAYARMQSADAYMDEFNKWSEQGIYFGNIMLNPNYKSGTVIVKDGVKTFDKRRRTDEDLNWPYTGESHTSKPNGGYEDIYYSIKEYNGAERYTKETKSYTVEDKGDYEHTIYVKMIEYRRDEQEAVDMDIYTIEKYKMTVSGEDDGEQGKDYLGNMKYIAVNGVYAVQDPTVANQICIIFNSLYIDDVWSRKGILVTSSIADFDERNYLGYSSFVSNNTNATYANPKMYPITNQSFTFWIELWDSYTEQKLELPPNSNVIIEACLCQKDKRSFNRD